MKNPEANFFPKKEESRHFTYFDYKNNRAVIFECEAKNILEADALYEEETGNNPAKQCDVGCTVEKILEEKPE